MKEARVNDEVLEKAMKKWAEDNRVLIEEEGYANKPEPYELDEGGYLDEASSELKIPDIEVARSEFLRANEKTARFLGLMICPIKEYRRLERENKRLERENRRLEKENENLRAENRSLSAENTHLRERIRWLEEMVRGLPTRKYRVLRQYGILQDGQVIETFNIPWAEGLVKQGVLEPVDGGEDLAGDEGGLRGECTAVDAPTISALQENSFPASQSLEGNYAAVEQYCPSVEKVVVLMVDGEPYGSMVGGVVKSCDAGRCGEAGFCWLGRSILTRI